MPVATAAVRAAAAGRRAGARGGHAGHERLRLVPGRLEVAGRAAGRDDAVVPLHRLPPISAAAAISLGIDWALILQNFIMSCGHQAC